jgi:hypothetical protein
MQKAGDVMAHVQAQCVVPLEDGTACRRAASFTCDNWHLICSSHRINEETRAIEELCPICNRPMVQFSSIEDGSNLVRRRKGDLSVAISTFLRAVSTRWFPELTRSLEPLEKSEIDERRE